MQERVGRISSGQYSFTDEGEEQLRRGQNLEGQLLHKQDKAFLIVN